MDLDKNERKERVHNNDMVNHEYIMSHSKIEDRFSLPENMVDEFQSILQEYCKIEKVWMPKNYLMYLEKSFDAIENEILGPKKDWSKIQIIDTGANLNHFLFDKDRDTIMEKNKKFGVEKVIQWCSSMRASVKAAENG